EPSLDPNLFHLDWARTTEVLATIILLSLLVERALSVLFESSWYIEKFQEGKRTRFKELLAFIVSSAVCIVWDFDAISMIVLAERTSWFGCIITGAVIAGGSKASIRLFRDWLGIKSTARRDYEARQQLHNFTSEEMAALRELAGQPPA